MRSDLVPRGLRVIRIEIPDGDRLPLALPTPFLAANRFQGEIPGGLMEPSREHDAMLQLFSVPGQGDKDSLAHFFRKAGIAQHSKCGRVNEIDVAMTDQRIIVTEAISGR